MVQESSAYAVKYVETQDRRGRTMAQEWKQSHWKRNMGVWPKQWITWRAGSSWCWLQECLSDCLYSFGEPFLARWPVSYMRRKALQQIAEFLKYEDENSQYICIGVSLSLCIPMQLITPWINASAISSHLHLPPPTKMVALKLFAWHNYHRAYQ